MGMAGKGEETGTGGGWLASLFERLKTAVERATDMICSEEPETLDEAEKLARRAGVIARAAIERLVTPSPTRTGWVEAASFLTEEERRRMAGVGE